MTNNNNNSNNNLPVNNHINESAEHRKDKKREKNTLRLIILICIAVGVAVVALNLKHFEGIGRTKITEAGFPVKLPGNSGYSISGFDGGFMLLTETYVYVYNADGSQRYNNRHSYSEPNAEVAETRILVYDKNGRQFSFFNRNGLAYERNTEERILYGAIGEQESAAIVYRSDSYANILEIYDEKGIWRYKTKFVDESVMQLAFTAADKDIILTSMSFKGVDVVTTVQKHDTKAQNDNNELWKTTLPGDVMPFAIHIFGDNVFVLCDKGVFILDSRDGKILKNCELKGTLIDYDFAGNSAALLVNDYTAGAIDLISLTPDKNESAEVSQGATQVEIYGGKIHILEPSAIAVYDINELPPTPQYLSLNEEYSRFIQSGGEYFLLSYNKVDKFQRENETTE